MNIIALIPARAGSKRIAGKNFRHLAGNPLWLYTLSAAKESGIFDGIYVSSDNEDIVYMCRLFHGVEGVLRPAENATDISPDIEWIDHFFRITSVDADAFAILRPTSPFRSAETIRRAWAEFQEKQPCDSIRAVEKGPNAHKLWWPEKDAIKPVATGFIESFGRWVPMHSAPSQLSPVCYKQNASLEISWTKNVTENYSISGDYIKPFFTHGYEGFDLNTEDDFILAEALIERGLAQLPEVK